jgi:hypothetical protein
MGMAVTMAQCTPCGSILELSRGGVQTTTIKGLEQFLAAHRGCRERGDVVIRQVGEGATDGK